MWLAHRFLVRNLLCVIYKVTTIQIHSVRLVFCRARVSVFWFQPASWHLALVNAVSTYKITNYGLSKTQYIICQLDYHFQTKHAFVCCKYLTQSFWVILIFLFQSAFILCTRVISQEYHHVIFSISSEIQSSLSLIRMRPWKTSRYFWQLSVKWILVKLKFCTIWPNIFPLSPVMLFEGQNAGNKLVCLSGAEIVLIVHAEYTGLY